MAVRIDLIKYLEEREKRSKGFSKEPGPVITISREFGCPSKLIAEKLTQLLNQKYVDKQKPWKWVSKEILSESAKALNTDENNIKYVFQYEDHGAIGDFIYSSQKYYKNDLTIKKTIAKIIRNLGEEGNVVIVGRGGVAITHDIPKSFHINLHAPLEWRAEMVSQKYQILPEKAREHAIQIDKKRAQFRNWFHGKSNDYTWFDICFNCMRFSVDEVAETIMKIIDIKQLVTGKPIHK